MRNFDGIVAVGTSNGEVYIVDICTQMCDEALKSSGFHEIRDELNPCQLNVITPRDVDKIETLKQRSIDNDDHLALHLNGIFFRLKMQDIPIC